MTSGAAPRQAGGADFRSLARRLERLFSGPARDALPDPEFNELALDVFRYQVRENPAYGAFCRARGATPESVDIWTHVPAVPTSAFKHLDVFAGDPSGAERVFRTSGTTLGAGARGRHLVASLDLYRSSLLPPFRAHLLPDLDRIRVLSLVPHADAAPDSSLSFMVAAVTDAYGAPGSATLVDAGGVDVDGFLAAAQAATLDGRPVLVAGTAFAFVHLLDALDARGERVSLPPGSRVMETGGFKGRSREMPRADLYEALERGLGVDSAWIVNEYGMTELLSQFYDGVAGRAAPVARQPGPGTGAPTPRLHRAPPWMRTRVLDPVTLAPVPRGEPGLLCHLDLANLGSVCAVLTEDMGVEGDGGFQVLGRAAGAEPRGCSLAMDDLLAAAREAS